MFIYLHLIFVDRCILLSLASVPFSTYMEISVYVLFYPWWNRKGDPIRLSLWYFLEWSGLGVDSTWEPALKLTITRHALTARALQWRHNGRDGFSNHQPHHSLFNRLFRRRSKKTSLIYYEWANNLNRFSPNVTNVNSVRNMILIKILCSGIVAWCSFVTLI